MIGRDVPHHHYKKKLFFFPRSWSRGLQICYGMTNLNVLNFFFKFKVFFLFFVDKNVLTPHLSMMYMSLYSP
jgi:hypothetical protein